jgi:hypothetical protein
MNRQPLNIETEVFAIASRSKRNETRKSCWILSSHSGAFEGRYFLCFLLGLIPPNVSGFLPDYVAFYRRRQISSKYTKLLGLSPQANYTDLATAVCRQS